MRPIPGESPFGGIFEDSYDEGIYQRGLELEEGAEIESLLDGLTQDQAESAYLKFDGSPILEEIIEDRSIDAA